MNKVLALRWLKKRLGEIFSLLAVTAVFFLTVEQLASLLNTCKSGNFPATEQWEFSSLIMNYFISIYMTQSGLMMNVRRNPALKYSLCIFHRLFCTQLH